MWPSGADWLVSLAVLLVSHEHICLVCLLACFSNGLSVHYPCYKTIYLSEEVNCTETFTSVSVPWPVYLPVCLPAWMSSCLILCLPACLKIYLPWSSVRLSVWLCLQTFPYCTLVSWCVSILLFKECTWCRFPDFTTVKTDKLLQF